MNTPRQLIGMVFLSALVACGGGKPPAPEPEPAPELEPEPEVAVEISPEAITLQQGASATFTASVTGTVNHAVVWSVAGIGGGSIDGAGVYTAPTSPGVYTVVATSVADPSKSATATVTVPVASGLGYVDPPEGGWRLVRSSLSTSSRLVLDLEGPAGEAGYGVDATLSVSSPRARWAKVSDSDTEHVVNRAFVLGSGPLLLKGLPKDELLLLASSRRARTRRRRRTRARSSPSRWSSRRMRRSRPGLPFRLPSSRRTRSTRRGRLRPLRLPWAWWSQSSSAQDSPDGRVGQGGSVRRSLASASCLESACALRRTGLLIFGRRGVLAWPPSTRGQERRHPVTRALREAGDATTGALRPAG